MSFGDWVRRQRRVLDLTQDELARQVGCATNTVKKIETGVRRPSKQMAERLATCLQVPAEALPAFLRAARLDPGLPVQEAREITARMAELARPRESSPADAALPKKARTNLPSPLTPFIGRKQETAELIERMMATRLLTLTGAGGVGKTRLAFEVAARQINRFADGVWLVELAPLTDPALVPQTVAEAMHILEQPGRPHAEALATFLENKQLLLVFDNCEHLIAACASLIEHLLRACPNVHILATSRESLRVPGEVIWRVPALTIPDPANLSPPEHLLEYEAIQLFVQHAGMAEPGFSFAPENAADIAQICHRLEGIPLAIEMAAAQVSALSVAEIAGSLGNQHALLSSGSRTAQLRHQTLRATLDWSYNLLSPVEQTLLAKLSVFTGSWTVDAAKAVCADSEVLPHLLQLVHKSLVVSMLRESRDQTRYQMLEVVRQYAGEKLGAQEARTLRQRHLDFYLDLAEMAEPKLHTGEAAYWLDRLELEHDNLRAAIDWVFENGESTSGLRLVGALCEFWEGRNHFQEQRQQLSKALAKSNPAERTFIRAKVLNDAGAVEWFYRNHDEARRLLNDALSISVELNDQAGIAQSLFYLGWDAQSQEDYSTARSRIENALSIWRTLGDKLNIAIALIVLAANAERQGDRPEARNLLEEVLSSMTALEDKIFRARALYRLGRIALHDGDQATAAAMCRQSLHLILEMGDQKEAASCLATFAAVAQARGQSLVAAQILGFVESLLAELGIPFLHGDVVEYEHTRGALQTELGEATFDAAQAEGRAMTFEQVVEYMLASG